MGVPSRCSLPAWRLTEWLLAAMLIGMAASAATWAASDAEPSSIQRQQPAEEASPRISVIQSPTPSCHYSSEIYDRCLINWEFHSVNAGAGASMLRLTIEIDGRLRAVHAGFFQSSMTVPGDMHGEGFAVPCGDLGAGGDPDLGNAYSYVIRAQDSTGLTAANFGTVRCPASPPAELFFDRFEASLLGRSLQRLNFPVRHHAP